MTDPDANDASSELRVPGKATLLAIVGVEKEQGVLCQHNACKHRVYRNIHVVDEGGHLLVLGSTCIKKRYGSANFLGKPSIGGANGRQLSNDERQMLVDNTEALLERFRKEAAEQNVLTLAEQRAPGAMAPPGWQQMPTASLVRAPWRQPNGNR